MVQNIVRNLHFNGIIVAISIFINLLIALTAELATEINIPLEDFTDKSYNESYHLLKLSGFCHWFYDFVEIL